MIETTSTEGASIPRWSGGMLPGKLLEFRSSEVAENALMSTYSRDILVFLK